jgi:hypothetical protein
MDATFALRFIGDAGVTRNRAKALRRISGSFRRNRYGSVGPTNQPSRDRAEAQVQQAQTGALAAVRCDAAA